MNDTQEAKKETAKQAVVYCSMCGKPLLKGPSKRRGIGPICEKKLLEEGDSE